MERRMMGKTGMQVSALGFGGSEIGFEKADTEAARELLFGALDAGLNVIDTAECYLESEELIGQVAAGRRDEFYLFTKCGHPDGRGHPANWSETSLLESIERSLRRLRVEHVDLVQLHSCSEETLRAGEAIAALQKARDKGWTRFIGYSGDGQAARYAIESGAFDTLQTSVSIADQEALQLTLPLARERGMGVIAKRPVANAAWRHPQRPENAYIVPYWERLRHLEYPFLHGQPGAAFSMALRFTLAVPGIHTAIVGTSRPGRWEQNADLLDRDGPIPPAEFEAIRLRWQASAKPDWSGLT
jgi:aryl-alcohol dehydrogenase-like predicted oxidoreductase